VGVIGVAGMILRFSSQVDAVITATIYPAVCAVRDRLELLFEVFTKSNRVALLWAVPAGVGLSLFARDLVEVGLGDQWRPAIGVLEAFGLITAAQQIAFNWSAFMRARGDTRPLASSAVLAMVTFMAAGVPLMFAYGLKGYAIGMAAVTVVQVASRVWFLRRRLFHGFGVVRHSLRAVAPTIPAAAAVLGLRALEPAGAGTGYALVELPLYITMVIALTMLLERALVREVLGYVRGGTAARPRLAVN
jgi:O-antigen/teichoic acid export membrane protein